MARSRPSGCFRQSGAAPIWARRTETGAFIRKPDVCQHDRPSTRSGQGVVTQGHFRLSAAGRIRSACRSGGVHVCPRSRPVVSSRAGSLGSSQRGRPCMTLPAWGRRCLVGTKSFDSSTPEHHARRCSVPHRFSSLETPRRATHQAHPERLSPFADYDATVLGSREPSTWVSTEPGRMCRPYRGSVRYRGRNAEGTEAESC